VASSISEKQMKARLTTVASQLPKEVHIQRGKKIVDIPALSVRPGDKLIVRPSEIVPVDAVIVAGDGEIEAGLLTNTRTIAVRPVGENVFSGERVIDKEIMIRASATANLSHLQQVMRLVRSSAGSRPPFLRRMDMYAVYFDAFSLLVASGAWLYSHQALRFLETILVATSGPLILGPFMVFLAALTKLVSSGVIVRSGSAFERLGRAQTFAFNKTGILTDDKLTVAKIIGFGDFKEDELLRFAATTLGSSQHLISKAICQAAEERSVHPVSARHLHTTPGQGVSATIAGKKVTVGQLSLLDKQGVARPKGWASARITTTAAYIAVDGQLEGAITFTEQIRPESKPMLERLRRSGIKAFLLVSGDTKAAVVSIANKLGINDFSTNATPADKLRAIEAAPLRPVVFVGDSVNDAPSLTAADVGIAFATQGEAAASESADALILDSDLGRVALAHALARKMLRLSLQVATIGSAISILLMGIAVFGFIPPIYGALIHGFMTTFLLLFTTKLFSN
jgi:P-type E1-E2 ATPase